MTEQTGYDATLDPRTGRPILPIDAENARKAEAESQPLGEEDNKGIAIEENDEDDEVGNPAVEEESDLPLPMSAEDEESLAPSAEDINTTVPRMKGPDDEPEDPEEDLIDDSI